MMDIIFFSDGESNTAYPPKLSDQISKEKNIRILFLKLSINSIIKVYKEIFFHILKKRNLIINSHHFKGAFFVFLIKYLVNSKKYKNIKWIHTFHAENNRFQGLKRKMNFLVYKNCDYLIGNSELVSLQWSKFLNTKNITTINNGISKEEYSKIKKSYKTPIESIKIIWVGRFEKVKNPLLMIEALEKIKFKSKKINFMMIGNGSLLKKVLIRAKIFNKKRENKNIDLNIYPQMERKEVLENIGNAKIYINTSSSESFCNAALEALVNKDCYLILPNINTLKNIYRFKNVVFYEKNSSQELVKNIKNLIKKINLDEISLKPRYFPEKFKLKNCAKEYVHIYNKILINK